MNQKSHSEWALAKRRCRLSDEEVRMARELGFQPKSLIKNIPSRSQQWKAPVRDWIRDLYEKKIGSRAKAVRPPEPRNPEYSWPDNPVIPELVWLEPVIAYDEDFWQFEFEPLPAEEIDQENNLMLRRQCLLRWAAQSVAIAMSELPEVQTVMAFGTAAQPLKADRRHRIEILHRCADLDLAVWLTGLSHLKELKNAMSRGLSLLEDTPLGDVAHFEVDVHVFDAEGSAYRGRLCFFGQCPKPGKPECRVRGCGALPFLRQLEGLQWNSARFAGEPRVKLFDRAAGFLVRPPILIPCYDAEDFSDDDVPF